ncbi:MAG: homoserine kinase [Vulcanibacillus sp.]
MLNKGQLYEVKVPASTANLGPGFDCFGLALQLYLTIRFKVAEENSIKLIGKNLASLPEDESNLIFRTIKYLFNQENEAMPHIALEIESDIPLSRGLGSSGSAIVGGLFVANHLLQKPKTNEELLQIATKLEGHPDNVGASLYGNFIVAAYDGEKATLAKFEFPESIKIVLMIPEYTLSTEVARCLIPDRIPLKDVSFNIGHASLLLAYILTGQIDKFPLAMKDRTHQPYRQKNIKGLQNVIELSEQRGIFSAALSGAGPTILFFAKEENLPQVYEIIDIIKKEENFEAEIKTILPAKEGTKITVL